MARLLAPVGLGLAAYYFNSLSVKWAIGLGLVAECVVFYYGAKRTAKLTSFVLSWGNCCRAIGLFSLTYFITSSMFGASLPTSCLIAAGVAYQAFGLAAGSNVTKKRAEGGICTKVRYFFGELLSLGSLGVFDFVWWCLPLSLGGKELNTVSWRFLVKLLIKKAWSFKIWLWSVLPEKDFGLSGILEELSEEERVAADIAERKAIKAERKAIKAERRAKNAAIDAKIKAERAAEIRDGRLYDIGFNIFLSKQDIVTITLLLGGSIGLIRLGVVLRKLVRNSFKSGTEQSTGGNSLVLAATIGIVGVVGGILGYSYMAFYKRRAGRSRRASSITLS